MSNAVTQWWYAIPHPGSHPMEKNLRHTLEQSRARFVPDGTLGGLVLPDETMRRAMSIVSRGISLHPFTEQYLHEMTVEGDFKEPSRVRMTVTYDGMETLTQGTFVRTYELQDVRTYARGGCGLARTRFAGPHDHMFSKYLLQIIAEDTGRLECAAEHAGLPLGAARYIA